MCVRHHGSDMAITKSIESVSTPSPTTDLGLGSESNEVAYQQQVSREDVAPVFEQEEVAAETPQEFVSATDDSQRPGDDLQAPSYLDTTPTIEPSPEIEQSQEVVVTPEEDNATSLQQPTAAADVAQLFASMAGTAVSPEENAMAETENVIDENVTLEKPQEFSVASEFNSDLSTTQEEQQQLPTSETVSYTHLTLPTKA